VKKHRGDSVDYDLTIRFRNAGKLPTALSQAHLVKMVKPDEVRIKIMSDSALSYRVIEPAPVSRRRESMMMFDEDNRRPEYITATAGYTPGGATAEVHFIIRVFEGTGIKGTATVITTRAGILQEKEFTLR